MVKLKLNVGRSYDGYGEQIVKKEEICLTNDEAARYLTQLIEEKGVQATKNWLLKVKGYEEDINGELHLSSERE